MKNLRNLVTKLSSVVPALALLIGVMSANSACIVYFHQPEVPSAMDEYRR